MKLCGSSIKQILIFPYILGNGDPPKIPYVSRNGNPKKLLIFWEMELFSASLKNKKIRPDKISYTLENGTF